VTMSVVSGQSSVVSRQSLVRLQPDDCRLKTEAGVVLIAVLWIFVGLAIIALSFSKESRVEVAAARNAQSMEYSYFVARAGMMATIYQIIQKRQVPIVQQTDESPDAIDLGKVTGNFSGCVYDVDIQDESGKLGVNLNMPLAYERIQALMDAVGIDKQDADIITDSIKDWRDSDSLTQPNGAENDYYQTLNPSYNAKNGLIDVLEELLLVRGMTPDYFYGHPERMPDGAIINKYGLSRYLSAYQNNPMVNVNSASIPVLLAIGVPPETARLIYARRRAKPFKNKQEITSEFAADITTGWAANLATLSTTQASLLSLTATAHPENSKVRRIVRAVITFDSSETGYRTLYWNENVPDYESVNP
jgi:general secretion pathway protein K